MQTKELQDIIHDTTGVMKQNVATLSERGERLDVLMDKSDNLAEQSNNFHRRANRLRKHMWLKDMRLRLCLATGAILLLVLIIVLVTLHLRR
jgi:vesicle-associated membrane protein 4